MSTDGGTLVPRTGRHRLLKWLGARCILPLALLAVALYFWYSGHAEAYSNDKLSRTGTGTVVAAEPFVPFFIDVTIQCPTGSVFDETSIRPNSLSKKLYVGQPLPVRYNPTNSCQAAYNGPEGDSRYSNGAIERKEGLAFLLLSIGILMFYVFRWYKIASAVPGSVAERHKATAGTGHVKEPPIITLLRSIVSALDIATGGRSDPAPVSSAQEVADRRKYQCIRLRGLNDAPDLEWRLLPGQPQAPETVFVRHDLAYRQWAVARLPDQRILWPASRTEPVMNACNLRMSREAFTSQDIIKIQRQLLTGYAQVMIGIKDFPFLIHRSPEDSARTWWYIGIPKMLVRNLIERHISLYTRALSDALTITASRENTESDAERRRVINEASQECAAMASIIRPHIRVANAITIVATALGLIGTFYAFPQVDLSTKIISPITISILLIISISGWLLLLWYSRSIQYTKSLFRPKDFVPDTSSGPYKNANIDNCLSLDTIEEVMFAKMTTERPKTWRESPIARWLVSVAYAAIIGSYIYAVFGPVILGYAVAYILVLLASMNWKKIIGIIRRAARNMVGIAKRLSQAIRY